MYHPRFSSESEHEHRMTIEILFTGNKSSASPELERDIVVGGILLNFDTKQNHISIKG